MNQPKIEIPQAEIAAFCHRWKIVELALFGSVLRDDFRPDSDVDFLVTYAPDAQWRLFDLMDAKEELAAIVGREVDLIDRENLKRSENYIRRREILRTAEPFYAA